MRIREKPRTRSRNRRTGRRACVRTYVRLFRARPRRTLLLLRTILTSRKRGPGARSTALKQHGGACRGHTVSGDPDDAAATGKLSITHCDAGNSAGDGDVGRRDWRVREETRRKFCCCVDGISKRNDLLPGLPPLPSVSFPAVRVHAPR